MSTSHALAGQSITSLNALRQRSQATQSTCIFYLGPNVMRILTSFLGDSIFTMQRDGGARQSNRHSASASGTLGSPLNSQNVAHQGYMAREDSSFYPTDHANNEFFLPTLLSDWESDINSILNIV